MGFPSERIWAGSIIDVTKSTAGPAEVTKGKCHDSLLLVNHSQ